MIITAKYLGPTNTKGARVKVCSYQHGTRYYPYDHEQGFGSYERSILQYVVDHDIDRSKGPILLSSTLDGVLAVQSNWSLME